MNLLRLRSAVNYTIIVNGQMLNLLDIPSLLAGYQVTREHCEVGIGARSGLRATDGQTVTLWLYSDVLPVCTLFCELDSGEIINCHTVDRITPPTLQGTTFVYPPPRLLMCPRVPIRFCVVLASQDLIPGLGHHSGR